MVPRVLSLMRGFLAPVEAALRGVVAMVSKGLNSQGFSSFISMLQRNAGPMITKLAVAIGHVVVGIGGILRAFMPVAQEMGSGLDSITAKFAKWGSTLSGHSGFQSLMTMFRSETPMAVHALGQIATLIKTVVSNMTGLSTFSNSTSLLKVLNPVLGILNKLAKVPGLVNLVLYLKLATDGGKKLSTAFKGIQAGLGVFRAGSSALQDFSAGFSNSAAAASGATGAWGTFGGKLSSIGSSISSMGSSVASFVSTYTAKLGTAIAATGTWIAEHAVAAGSFIAENITMAASATAAFIAENAATLGLVAGIAALVAGIVYLATHWRQVWGAIKDVVRDAVDFVKAHWKLLPAIFLGPLGIVATIVLSNFGRIKTIIAAALHAVQDVARNVWGWFVDYIMVQVDAVKTVLSWFSRLGSLFRGWWDGATRAVQSAAGVMISFVRGIPGKILSALSHLASDLYSLGRNIVMGLIHGIESAGPALISAAEGLAGKVLGPFKGVLGLFSPSRVMITHGQNTVRGLIIGMDSMHGQLAAASTRMANTLTGAAHGGVSLGAGGGGGGITIEFHVPPGGQMLPQDFWTEFQRGIRVRGGDQRIVSKKVKFA
jgi:hypothetical protein